MIWILNNRVYLKNKKPAMEDKIRLSVIDDHPVVLLGVKMALRKWKGQTIELVNEYTNGAKILNDLPNLNSNVLLIDMFLPDFLGYDLVKKILEVYPDMKIGMYSNMMEKEYILNSFKNGALGYLPKTASPSDLLDFIKTIAKGERYIKGEIADIVLSENPVSNPPLYITKREKEIMHLIFKGFKNREIADQLFIADRTVEFHKNNIYQKLEVNNSIDLYKSAQRLNLFSQE